MFQGVRFIQMLYLGAVALLIASSGVGRGEPLVIAPPGAYGPEAHMIIPPGVGRVDAEAPVVR